MCEVKTCEKCGTEKTMRKDASRKSGVRFYCVPCDNERQRVDRSKRGYTRREYHVAYYSVQRNKVLEGRIGECCEVHNRVCVDCGKAECVKMPKREGLIIRCNLCQRVYSPKGTRGKTWSVSLKNVECSVCKCEFIGKNKGSMCDPCRRERKREERRRYVEVKDSKRALSHKKRCIKYGCTYEEVRRKVVYQRDGYKCAYCKCDVYMTKGYAPNQATIDHVVPLSKGGPHTYNNIVTACQSCNSAKGDTMLDAAPLSISKHFPPNIDRKSVV